MIINPLTAAIKPAQRLLPKSLASLQSEALLLAIGFQESRFLVREQAKGGPARGFWQFEQGGGVRGVLLNSSTRRMAKSVADHFDLEPHSWVIWNQLNKNDVLAAAFARLLLWAHPYPLPDIGNLESSWTYYVEAWDPGKPHRNRWNFSYERAMTVLNESLP